MSAFPTPTSKFEGMAILSFVEPFLKLQNIRPRAGQFRFGRRKVLHSKHGTFFQHGAVRSGAGLRTSRACAEGRCDTDSRRSHWKAIFNVLPPPPAQATLLGERVLTVPVFHL
jgi:hypothetical protein